MPQKTSPFLEGKWGWNLGEGLWNTGADENWLKFSYLFDRNVDGIVSSLPPAVNGQAYFNTTDNRFYFVVDGTYYSSPCPKWFVFVVRTTGEQYQFDGVSAVLLPGLSALQSSLTSTIAELNGLEDILQGDTGGSYLGYKSSLSGAVKRSLLDIIDGDFVRLSSFYPVGDGTYHPLSERFSTLAEAQLAYPNSPITALTDSIDWAALYSACYAAAIKGYTLQLGAVHLILNRYVIAKCNINGQGTEAKWQSDGRGSILETYSTGNPERWTDIDGLDLADFTPCLVVGRSDVSLTNFTVRCGADRWSAGIFVPSTRRNILRNVDCVGQWKKGGLYLDATWSSANTTLTPLHPEIESDAGLNEFSAEDCFFEGLWGAIVQGTTRSSSTTPWVWSPGGTSDHSWVNVRFGTSGPDVEKAANGGAYKHDAVIPNTVGAGQGHNFVNCSFRVNAKYTIYLDHSNRDCFANCYAETISSWITAGNPEASWYITSNTGNFTLINCAMGQPVIFDGVEVSTNSLPETEVTGGKMNIVRFDGYLSLPNIYASASSSVPVKIKSKTTTGAIQLASVSGTTITPYLNFNNTTMAPAVAGAVGLGTTTFYIGTCTQDQVRIRSNLRPTTNNTVSCGESGFAWSGGFTQTAFTVTSDENLKTFSDDVTMDVVLDVWESLSWRSWKFNDSIENKGEDKARVHFGLGAQTVVKAFEDAGLDPFKYALICYDKWEELYEHEEAVYEDSSELDENGHPIPILVKEAQTILVREAGERYGIRYEEALALEAAVMRRTTQRLKDRLDLLEGK